MKKSAIVLTWTLFATLPLFAVPNPGGEKQPESPLARSVRNREYVARYANSFAVVRYWTQKNDKGDEPKFEVPYICPNCHGTHYRDDDESSEKGIPAEFVGFLIAPDRVLMKDLLIEPEFVKRIDVECAGETIAAVEFESSPERGALVLKTERPFKKGKPLAFVAGGEAPANPAYFFLVREKGETVAGFASSKIANFRHHVELGKDLYEGNPNTLVLNERGEAVTVALESRVELGKETFQAPTTWKLEPASKRFERLAALESRFRKAVFPVYLQFETKGKESGGMFRRWSSHGEEIKNDVDTVGILVEGGKVIVPAKIAAADTARLVKLEATLPDGTKTTLEFVGSYAEESGFEAKFQNGVPKGLEPFVLDSRAALKLWDGTFAMFAAANRGGKLDVRRATCAVEKFSRIRGNVVAAKFEQKSGMNLSRWDSSDNEKMSGLVLSDDGKLVMAGIPGRHEDRGSSSELGMQGAYLAALVASPKFDPENIPRKAGDRKRTPWLGVETQPAGADIVREKKATSFIKRYVDRAPMVTSVASGSPAEKIGIKVGDILISVKYPGSSNEESLSDDRDRFSGINWEEIFGDDRFLEFGSTGEITPWSDVEGGVNGTLAQFGVGTEVVIAWVSDGVRKEGKTALALAPVHFRNAPRSRNMELGMTVCDMTYEVRKYFKFDENAPGVVVAKVKSGGVAAVSGIRPLELIIDVNGEGVKSAKDFLEKTKGKKELNFTVRRLTNTRVVPIKM